MKARLIFSAFAALLFLSGCKTTKQGPIIVERVRTEVKTVRDTVVDIQLVPQFTEATVLPSDTSQLETKYAASFAWYDGAALFHTLENKSGALPVKTVVTETVITDSVPVPYPVYIDKEIEIPVRMPLRWYECTLIVIGATAIGACIGLVIMKIKKII